MSEDDNHGSPSDARPGAGSWSLVLRGRLGVYSAILNLGVGLFAIDTYVISTIMPTVISDIGGTGYYTWTFMLYMVGSIIGASSAGPVRERFGRRNGYAFAGLLFVLGNLGAALSPDILVLVFWRLVQGLGGGLIISQSYGMVGDVYPPELRTRILTMISSTWGVATVIGPAFGGVFAEFGEWRGAFWAIVPLGLAFAALAWRYVPASEPASTTSRIPIVRLLMLGGGILCVGFTSQTEDNMARAALVLVALALVVIAFRRDGTAERPIFPGKTLVIYAEIGAAYWVILLTTMTFSFAVMYATLYLQVLHGQTPIVAAYIHTSMSICWTLSALVVAGWTGRGVWWAVMSGGLLLLAGTLILLTQATTGPVIMAGIGLALVGVGMGFSNNHMISLAILAAPVGQESLAGSSVQTMRTLGVGFGAALAGLFANAGGIIDAVVEISRTGRVVAESPALLAKAVDWVHWADVALAFMTVVAIIVFFTLVSRREAAGSP